MAVKDIKPLIVIVGPTASGKTNLAVKLAERYNGEIICADSRTIYKYMDIGTAKPTKEEQARVPHWGLDLVEPDQSFSAADFKQYAEDKIRDIRSRGHVPFLVGGTGLYVDAVIFDYQFGPKPDERLRSQLEQLSLGELTKYCEENNIELPENRLNRLHLIRAIEQKGINHKRNEAPMDQTHIVGISTRKELLMQRISQRSEQLLKNGVVEEATILGKKYGWESPGMTGNIYPLAKLLIERDITSDEFIAKFTTTDWRLAKRQLTWLRRNPYIKWLDLEQAEQYLLGIFANEQ